MKGPKGELHQTLDPDFKVTLEGTEVKVHRPTEQKRHKAMHGLLPRSDRQHGGRGKQRIPDANELIGVGFKAAAQGNVLELSLGYSHTIFVGVPAELKLQTVTEKGANPMIILEGHRQTAHRTSRGKDQIARKVEPYKGKGIRYVGEYVRRKAGKAAAK